jgi:hypothetical protein
MRRIPGQELIVIFVIALVVWWFFNRGKGGI